MTASMFTSELISAGLIDEIAEAARKHNVMISITVTPYDEEVDE